MAIDKSSPEYMFGQIMTRLSDGDRSINELKEAVDDVAKSVSGLPCTLHDQRLAGVESWQNTRNGRAMKKAESSVNLRHGLIIGISSAAAAAGFAALFVRIFN